MPEWSRQIAHAVHRRTGQLPAPTTARNLGSLLARMTGLLAAALDTGPWWRREDWDPVEDGRIPLREHEPMGRYTVRFGQITTGWLRAGAQWHCKTGLETGTLTWSSVHHRVCSVREFDAFLAGRQVSGPALADGPAAVRALMLEFLARAAHPPGQPRAPGREAAVRRGGRAPGRRHRAVLRAHGRQQRRRGRRAGRARLAGAGTRARRVLPARRASRRGPAPAGGPGHQRGGDDADHGRDRPAGRARRRRRLRRRAGHADHPAGGPAGQAHQRDLHAGPRPAAAAASPARGTQRQDQGEDGQAPVAKLRYQQTKIDGAPDTVLVHDEVVAIIREQQQWAAAHAAACCAPGTRPKYLFLAAQMNRNGDRPYSDRTLRGLLTRLAARLGVRDDAGALVDFNRTHRFRHTAATSLLNAGVPIHVVQRYLGHLTPAMTMRYAQTLAETAEAEFLRFRKLTADARPVQADPRDLYDMLQLDSRTDRVLPNGWCLLPPRQSCDRGNACLTCGKFATDATFLPELRVQKERTLTLIDSRQAAFTARTGAPMAPGNVWLDGRQREADALGAIITALETAPETPADGKRSPRSAPGPLSAPTPPSPARTSAMPGNTENLQQSNRGPHRRRGRPRRERPRRDDQGRRAGHLPRPRVPGPGCHWTSSTATPASAVASSATARPGPPGPSPPPIPAGKQPPASCAR